MSKQRRPIGPGQYFGAGAIVGFIATVAWVAAATSPEEQEANLGGAIILSMVAACFLIIGCIKVGTRDRDTKPTP